MSDDLMNEIAAAKDKSSIIMVVGVGGAGGNAVNHMWNLGIKDVGFMVCNTDAQALDNSPVEEKVQLGREGLGAGNDPENGRKAAIESLDDIRRRLEAAGTRMLFVTAGMGGGTGTGASPVIAKLAHEMGILTVGIVTSPLAVEGKIRYEQAFRGIEELSRNVDSLLVINNENIVEMYGRLSLKQAFGKADDILASAAKGIAEIITVESDMVNVDFADVSKVMRDSGRAHMSVATAEGEHRAAEVARASLESPLLDHTLISGAKNILLNISTSDADSLALDEVMEILKYIQSHASVQAPDGTVHDANIIWGTSVKPQLGRRIELVVVATGFDSAAIERRETGRPARRRPRRAAPRREHGARTDQTAPRADAAAHDAGDAGRTADTLQEHRGATGRTGLPDAQGRADRRDLDQPQGGAQGGGRRRGETSAGEGRLALRLIRRQAVQNENRRIWKVVWSHSTP